MHWEVLSAWEEFSILHQSRSDSTMEGNLLWLGFKCLLPREKTRTFLNLTSPLPRFFSSLIPVQTLILHFFMPMNKSDSCKVLQWINPLETSIRLYQENIWATKVIYIRALRDHNISWLPKVFSLVFRMQNFKNWLERTFRLCFFVKEFIKLDFSSFNHIEISTRH